ncbi:MAG: phosphoenolpyruvate hydrolase family protein [Actinobacteria bacterium]|nr:phosphoenolpyruvate hydrolase family protein [Actinomycetota bacterium]
MAKRYNAKEVVDRLREEIKSGRPLFMPNCGMGLSAKLQEKGGADLICISSTSWWRMKGLGSLSAFLPYGDCNQIVFELAKEILPMVKEAPVISISGPHNPLMEHRQHLKKLWDMGISGINPLPTELYDEGFREQIEYIGMGWSQEVEFIRVAHEMNMFTFGYASNPKEAEDLADAGADIVGSHLGATRGGAIGAKTGLTLEESAEMSQEIFDAAKKINKDIILFAHGGPMENPEAVEYILKNTDAHGFTGGSAAERIPIEKAILEITRTYKNIPIRN